MEMNRLGMLIDLAHVPVEVMNQVLEMSRAPVIFSHSSTYTKCKHKRNVPDEVIKKVVSVWRCFVVSLKDFPLGNFHFFDGAQNPAGQQIKNKKRTWEFFTRFTVSLLWLGGLHNRFFINKTQCHDVCGSPYLCWSKGLTVVYHLPCVQSGRQ